MSSAPCDIKALLYSLSYLVASVLICKHLLLPWLLQLFFSVVLECVNSATTPEYTCRRRWDACLLDG